MFNWSLKTWILVIGTLFAALFVYFARAALAPFFIALVLVYLLDPLVSRLCQVSIRGRPCPRVVSVILVLSVMVGGLVGLVSYLVPALAQEVRPFRESMTAYSHQLQEQLLPDVVMWLQRAVDQAGINLNVHEQVLKTSQSLLPSDLDGTELVKGVQHLISGVFSAIFDILLIFILTLFMLLDLPRFKVGFWDYVPERLRAKVHALVDAVDRDLSGSIRGQLTICFINFVLTTVGLLILDVKYAVTLGVIAGTFSIIPVFGSIVSTVPIILVSLTVSVLAAFKAVVVIIVIHLLEANFLNPKVMGAHVELHAVVILLAIVIAEHMFGPVGLLVGVPIAASLRSILRFTYDQLVPPDPPHPGLEAPLALSEPAGDTPEG